MNAWMVVILLGSQLEETQKLAWPNLGLHVTPGTSCAASLAHVNPVVRRHGTAR